MRLPPLPPLSRRGFLASAAGVAAAGSLIPRRARAATEMRDEVSQHGVTFRFAAPRAAGRYATGDWFVVGPVEIVEITPASARTSDPLWKYWEERKDRVIHGAQLEYHAQDRRWQALDDVPHNIGSSFEDFNRFVPEANVDPGFAGRPLRIETPRTVIKAVSLPAKEVGNRLRPVLSDIVFLTVVDEAPPEGAFRPSAEPGDKRSRWSEADLDWSVLTRMPHPPGMDHAWDFKARLRLNVRPHWNAHTRYDFCREMMAQNNQHTYGREHSWENAYAALALCSDAPEAEKRELFVALVQQGLDLVEMIEAGQLIKAADGNSLGRALPLAVAAAALKDPVVRRAADAQVCTASEHGQFFHVDDSVVGHPRVAKDRPRAPYPEDMRGVPEFGGQHLAPGGELLQPERNGSHYDMSYRDIVSNPTFAAGAAALALRGVSEAWNQPALFDYLDRWYGIERHRTSGEAKGLSFGNGVSEVAFVCWRDWRGRSDRPVHRARPEVMVLSRTNYHMGLSVTHGSPLLVPRKGAVELHPQPNPHRDGSLDGESTYEVRISHDGQDWRSAGEMDLRSSLLPGLPSGQRVFVQMRQVHPERGAGPWSFDWVWWREGLVYDGRHSLDGQSWSAPEDLGPAPAMFDWVSRTHRRKAPHVQIRKRDPAKGTAAEWAAPFWLHPDLDFEPIGAGAGELQRNVAYAPSVVTF